MRYQSRRHKLGSQGTGDAAGFTISPPAIALFFITLTALILSPSQPFPSFCPSFSFVRKLHANLLFRSYVAPLPNFFTVLQLLFQNRADCSNEVKEETAKVSTNCKVQTVRQTVLGISTSYVFIILIVYSRFLIFYNFR